jgi:helix-turn-helix protein
MIVTRAPRPSDHYAQIHNEALRDERLSFRARGVLAYLLSLPPGWSTDSRTLASKAREGRDAVRNALRELEACGYLVTHRDRDEQGRWRTSTTVFDTPQVDTGPDL